MNCKPELIKSRKKEVVSFKTRFFELSGKQYEIIATMLTDTDAIHTVKNVATGESRDVAAKQIYKWFNT